MVEDLKSLGDEIAAGSILLFGGLGIIVAHYIEKSKGI